MWGLEILTQITHNLIIHSLKMAGLKEIRIRIASVKTTRQVTSAMKIVSAAKLKKAQDAIYQIRPYATKLQGILRSISASLDEGSDSVFTMQRES